MIHFNMFMSTKAEFLHTFQAVASFLCLIIIQRVNKNSPYKNSGKWEDMFRFSLLSYSCSCLDELYNKFVLQTPTAALDYDPSKSMNTQTNLMSKWKTVTGHVNPGHVLKARRISTTLFFHIYHLSHKTYLERNHIKYIILAYRFLSKLDIMSIDGAGPEAYRLSFVSLYLYGFHITGASFHLRFFHRKSNLMEISFLVISVILQWSLQNFVRGATTVLSWHVHNLVVIRWPSTGMQQCEIPIEFVPWPNLLVKWAFGLNYRAISDWCTSQ